MFRVLSVLLLLLLSFNKQDRKLIVFFGDSITAGYGINIESAFPALIQEKLNEQGDDFEVVNAGLSGETTAGGLQRIDWVLRTGPDIFVLELGGNDGLRGLSLDQTRQNLKGMISKIREASSSTKIILAGMKIPPNLGQNYTEEFSQLFSEIAKSEKVELIPFLLENVGGEKKLNLSDGIHPNEAGHKIVAETVWAYLKPLIN